MSFDPNLPPDPLDVEAPLSPEGVTAGTGLPRNIAAALASIFVLIGGIIFYALDRRDRFVRFYALQSIVLGLVFCASGLALSISAWIFHLVPWIGAFLVSMVRLLNLAVGIVFLILWLPMIWHAYNGRTVEMPYLWRTAKRHIPPALL